MSSSDHDSTEREPSGSDESKPAPDGGHVSFVQRLHRTFGSHVDPQINLQDDSMEWAEEAGESGGDGEGKSKDPSSQSSTSRGLLKKLTSQGAQVESRYRISREIARGGMGTILRVWDDDLRRNLAMKVMLGKSGSLEESDASQVDEEKLGRFLEEAQITGQLDHPGVVPVHNLGIDHKGRCYFTMRLVRGRELKEVLDLTREKKEGWTMTKALGLVLKVCEAMAFAHSKGVIHRDLKPANVMVGRFGETYVMDWGLARVLGHRDAHQERLKAIEDPSSLSLVRTVRKDESAANPDSPLVTMDGDVVGTPSYMAVEQARGRLEELGPRSDVYSLGAILYYLLTGKAPYVKEGERVSPHTVLNRVLQGPPIPVSKLAKDSPQELVAICEKAMAREAEDRYGSMLEVAEDIQAFLENRVVSAYEGGSIAEFRKWVARNQGMAAATAALIILSLASAFGFAIQKSRRVTALNDEKKETTRAWNQAKENLAQAQRNEEQARENEEIANQKREEAAANAKIALANEQMARRSSYRANVLAADFSLRLNEVGEARRRLRECDRDLRGWEWAHINLKSSGSLASYGPFAPAVDGVDFSPDGNLLYSFSRRGKFHIHDFVNGGLVPPDDIYYAVLSTSLKAFAPLSMDVSADGLHTIITGRNKMMRIHDLGSGARAYDLPRTEGSSQGHDDRVTAVAFSPNGRRVASGDEDGVVVLWDVATQEVAHRLSGHGGEVTDLAWTSDSTALASTSVDGTATVWSADDGRELGVFRGHLGPVHAVAWDTLDQGIFTAGSDRQINRWDLESGALALTLSGHEGAVFSLDFDEGHRRLVSGSEDGTVRIWNFESPEPIVLRGHDGAVLDVDFRPQGDVILSGGEDGYVKTWDVRGDLSFTELIYDPGIVDYRVEACAFHPESIRAVTGGNDKSIIVWDTVSGEPLRKLEGHDGFITSLSYSADGRFVLSSSLDKTARLWDAETGKVHRIFSGHEKWIEAAAITPDGARVVTASGERIVRVFDTETTELLREFSGFHRYAPVAVDISADGERIASCGKKIFLWSLHSDEPVLELDGHRLRSKDVAFSPDGTRLVSVSIDGAAKVWDLESGEEIAESRDHDGQVRAVAFLSDGTRFATGGEDGTIHIRDAVTAESVLLLRGHRAGVYDLAFSSDGTRLLSTSGDGTGRVWETGAVQERRAYWAASVDRHTEAEGMVERLYGEFFYQEEVLRRIEANTRITRELRETAIRLVRFLGEAPELLDRQSREIVLFPGQTVEDYELSRDRAEAAARIDPNSARLRFTLGVAEYRAGGFDRAVEFLEEAHQMNRVPARTRTDPPFSLLDETVRLFYLAMAHHRNEEPSRAQSVLLRARKSVEDSPELGYHALVQALAEEAGDLIEGA